MISRPLAEQRGTPCAGTRYGRYEVIALIGRGGMGEVYRARDTQLQRDVALKLLPAEYGSDADRLRRFEHEARALGQVSHANIVAIYDFGKAGDAPFVVTELLEGETLREVLSRGPIEHGRAIAIALQVARGLAAAHHKGIIHRDLKPANIFITRQDEVKILDFGLAKLAHREWDQAAEVTVTHPGVVVGTVAYMSPEQLEGARVDFRTDIFSLGAILYEMLTGARPFEGKSPASVAAAVLREKPRHLTSDPSTIPPAILPILTHCLEKAADARFQSVRDLTFALEQNSRPSPRQWSTMTLDAVRRSVRRPSVRRGAALSSLTVVLIVLLLLNTSDRGPEAEPTREVPRSLQMTRITTTGDVGSSAGLSTDGVYIAYVRSGPEASAIWLRHLPSESEVKLAGGAGFEGVRISPDRNFVYYTAGEPSSLYRLPLLGGEPRKIVEDISVFSPVAFSRNGSRIALVRRIDGESAVWVAGSDGSGLRKVASRPGAEFRSCAWSPDSRRIACTAEGKEPLILMLLVDVTTGAIEERRGFFSERANYLVVHEWADDDTIVGASSGFTGALWKIPLTGNGAKRLTNDLAGYSDVTMASGARSVAAIQVNTIFTLWRVPVDDPGGPHVITSGFNTQDGRMGVAAIPDGRVLYSSFASGKSLDIWIANADGSGKKRLTFDDSSDEVRPKVSANGTFILYIRRSDASAYELWRSSTDGQQARKLTDHAEGPSISPDGSTVYFTRNLQGGPRLYRMPADGGEVTKLSERQCAHISISPDGGRAMATCAGEPGGPRIVIWPLDGKGKEMRFPTGRAHTWRPDGKAFAHTGTGAGANIHVQPLDGSPAVQLTNFSGSGWGGFDWARDGRSLIVPRWQSARDIVLLTESQ